MRRDVDRDDGTVARPSVFGRRVAEWRRLLGVSPGTFYRWIHKHGLRATAVGHVWYVRDDDFEKFCAARTTAKLRRPAPVDPRAHEAADRALDAAGW